MGKRIFWVAILAAAVVCGYLYYKHHQEEVRLASGDVTCDGCMSPDEHTKFVKDTAIASTDSASTSGKAAAGTPPAESTGTVNAAASPAAAQPAAAATAVRTAATVNSDASAAPPPATDTIAANPPNGMVFSGKGTYQWYRQGNLTWRVDTTSGRSCIIYATLEEWRKPIVHSHACGRDA